MKELSPITIAVIVLVLWFATFLVGYSVFDSWQERGQFGDMFGSVNALFSGLAFAGLIYAILLQRKELSLQRDELKLQREEMAASRKELAAQVAAQRALFLAAVGQIRVAAEQARIEALKMESETNIPTGRGKWINKIREIADRIESEADIQETV